RCRFGSACGEQFSPGKSRSKRAATVSSCCAAMGAMLPPGRGVHRGRNTLPSHAKTFEIKGLAARATGTSAVAFFCLELQTAVAGESTSSSRLAGRYATALVDLATESKTLDAVAGELKRIKDLLDGSPDLKRLVRSPVYSREEQGAAMDAILAKLNVSTLTQN